MSRTVVILSIVGLLLAGAVVAILVYGQGALQAATIGALAAVLWKLIQSTPDESHRNDEGWQKIDFLRRVEFYLSRARGLELEIDSPAEHGRVEMLKTATGYLHNNGLLSADHAAETIGSLDRERSSEKDLILMRLLHSVRLAIAKHEAENIGKTELPKKHPRY